MSWMRILNKGWLGIVPGVYYTIHWNCFCIYPLKSFLQITWTNFIALKEKYLVWQAKKLCLSVSIALDRPINIVPTYLPSSTPCLHFLAIFSKAFCLLWFLWNPIKNGKKIDLKRKVHLIPEYFFKYLESVAKNNNGAIIFFT